MNTMTHPNPSKLASRGTNLFDHVIRPQLRPEDNGKYVAIDTVSGQFELHEDDYSAVMTLRRRIPDADIWLARAGYPAAYTIRSVS